MPILCFLALFALTACYPLFTTEHWEDKQQSCDVDNTVVTFKKVAFWSEDTTDNLDLINYKQLTHINYASLDVNADASLLVPEDPAKLEELIELGQADGVKVGVSLGAWNGSNDSNFNIIAANSQLTRTFVNNIIEYLDENELDGIDLNWQFPAEGDEAKRYKSLVKALSEKLREENKFFSITVASGENEARGDAILSSLFDYVDFMNVMAFDSNNKDDLHSSLQDATDAVDYWTGRCLIKNKLVLGIPFYSRGDSVESYADIIDEKRAYACKDESKGRNYNGIPTVIEKTNYARNNAGGVMIKSLEQDTYETNLADYSLLNAIHETASGNVVTICP